jgi:mercuric reductase
MPSTRLRGVYNTWVKPMPESDDAMRLDDQTRRLHRTLIDGVLVTGNVPALSALASQLETSLEAIQEGLQDLGAADYLALDVGGQVTCLYPLSVTPTPHAVIVNGAQRFAMCAIDALGMPAMLDRELDIEGSCAVCNTTIAMQVRPSTIVAVAPPTTMVVARRDESEPAFAACCPFTVFVCGQEHADQFMRRIAGTRALSLLDALQHAEAIFGSLLAEEIPASRPRGRHWGESGDA